MMSTKSDKWRNLSTYLYDYIFENNLGIIRIEILISRMALHGL
jgi:hypothetical protein